MTSQPYRPKDATYFHLDWFNLHPLLMPIWIPNSVFRKRWAVALEAFPWDTWKLNLMKQVWGTFVFFIQLFQFIIIYCRIFTFFRFHISIKEIQVLRSAVQRSSLLLLCPISQHLERKIWNFFFSFYRLFALPWQKNQVGLVCSRILCWSSRDLASSHSQIYFRRVVEGSSVKLCGGRSRQRSSWVCAHVVCPWLWCIQ